MFEKMKRPSMTMQSANNTVLNMVPETSPNRTTDPQAIRRMEIREVSAGKRMIKVKQ